MLGFLIIFLMRAAGRTCVDAWVVLGYEESTPCMFTQSYVQCVAVLCRSGEKSVNSRFDVEMTEVSTKRASTCQIASFGRSQLPSFDDGG